MPIEEADVCFSSAGWAFGGNDNEVSVGNSRSESREEGGGLGRWSAGQCVDNGNISLLGSNIMLKVNGR